MTSFVFKPTYQVKKNGLIIILQIFCLNWLFIVLFPTSCYHIIFLFRIVAGWWFFIYIYICKVKAKATKILKCIKTLFTVKTLKNIYTTCIYIYIYIYMYTYINIKPPFCSSYIILELQAFQINSFCILLGSLLISDGTFVINTLILLKFWKWLSFFK